MPRPKLYTKAQRQAAQRIKSRRYYENNRERVKARIKQNRVKKSSSSTVTQDTVTARKDESKIQQNKPSTAFKPVQLEAYALKSTLNTSYITL
ncbi:hypothetical protein V5O48_017392 [Marasmius crinis-equi]|uniref:Uncharacterized protein n=1 Tax=Marasmius crinis-equi TaxID=585013 RepID=A0ABR3EPB1_9AGAR